MGDRKGWIRDNQKRIRALNPGAKVEYPVEYATLDNNAVFVAARIINSMGFDFLDYEDIFKQDFLAAAGYINHYSIDDDAGYYSRLDMRHMKPPFLFFRMQDNTVSETSFDEAVKYNEDIVYGLYPVLWKYCSDNICKHVEACINIDQALLNKVYNMEFHDWLYGAFIPTNLNRDTPLFMLRDFPFPAMIGIDNNLQLSEEAINCIKCSANDKRSNYEIAQELLDSRKMIIDHMYNECVCGYHMDLSATIVYLFESSLKCIFWLIEQLTISLVKDCCGLIHQIKMNSVAGRDIMQPLYDIGQQLQQQQEQTEPIQLVSVMPGTLGKGNPKADISQDAINEMAATVEPELLNSLSAGKIMPSFEKNPYAQVEAEYTDVEMDIVRYIMQDMIDAVKVV